MVAILVEFTIFIIPTNLQIALYKKILEGAAVRAVLSGVGAQQLSLLMILRSLSNTPGLLLKQIQEVSELVRCAILFDPY